jgi:hypothetical protein
MHDQNEKKVGLMPDSGEHIARLGTFTKLARLFLKLLHIVYRVFIRI